MTRILIALLLLSSPLLAEEKAGVDAPAATEKAKPAEISRADVARLNEAMRAKGIAQLALGKAQAEARAAESDYQALLRDVALGTEGYSTKTHMLDIEAIDEKAGRFAFKTAPKGK